MNSDGLLVSTTITHQDSDSDENPTIVESRCVRVCVCEMALPTATMLIRLFQYSDQIPYELI